MPAIGDIVRWYGNTYVVVAMYPNNTFDLQDINTNQISQGASGNHLFAVSAPPTYRNKAKS